LITTEASLQIGRFDRRSRLSIFLLRALRQNAMFLFLSSVYIFVALVLSNIYDLSHSLVVYDLLWLAAAGLVFLLAYIANAKTSNVLGQIPLIAPGNGRGWRFRVYKRIAIAAPVFLVFPLFISSFTSLKASLGEITPYDLDHALMVIDRFLHGGVSAWRLLQPLVGYPVVTAAISIVYEAWFPILAIVVTAVALSARNMPLRNQFLVTLVLTWAILGTLLPLLLPAVGPCFYGLLYPDRVDPFRPLMEYLIAADGQYTIRALDLQQALWADFQAGELRPGSGISATPSMHVAIATLIALLARRVSRLLAMAALVFVILTVIATVHLGWHYAVDGYISLLAVPAIWYWAGRIAMFNVRGERLARVFAGRT
jgi:hypothetical protein